MKEERRERFDIRHSRHESDYEMKVKASEVEDMKKTDVCCAMRYCRGSQSQAFGSVAEHSTGSRVDNLMERKLNELQIRDSS